MSSVVFLDSSVLFNLLDVPGKNGDRATVVTKFQRLAGQKTTFVFPVTAVIEAGNVIAQLSDGGARHACMERFVELLRKALNTTAPLAVSGVPWDQGFLTALLDGGGDRISLVDFAHQGPRQW